LLEAIEVIAPGTPLRQAVDDVIRSHEGALIVIGDPQELAFLYSGGIRLDAPFRPQLLYELAKMDGAIIVDTAIKRLAWANVQLMPDPTIPSEETGTRHRTAERVAKQTGALVVSVSQQRETVTIFVGAARYQLDPVADVLAKTNQALGTLDTYRQRLEQVLTRLTALEFQNAVVLDDVLVTLQRAEMTSRMAERIKRDCVELGSEGRLIRLQLEELVGDVPVERDAIVRDYHAGGHGPEATLALEGLRALPYQGLLEFERLTELLGHPRGASPLDTSVQPRGYRVLSHIPRLPEHLVGRVVAELGSLDAVVRASQRDLEGVEGVGAVRAREIRDGLRRLQEHNLAERYLQL
jgi:diadenylate cyclase